MKINVNKLILMACVFCMSFVFANVESYIDDPNYKDTLPKMSALEFEKFKKENDRNGPSAVTFTIPEDPNDPNYRALVTFEVSNGECTQYCYPDERRWGLWNSDPANPDVPGSEADIHSDNGTQQYTLDPGDYQAWMGDTYGDTWNGGILEISVGGVVIASGTNDDGDCEYKSSPNAGPAWCSVKLDFTTNLCDDPSACNYNEAGACVQAAAGLDCDGNCVDTSACNAGEADAGDCVYPGFNEDCSGACVDGASLVSVTATQSSSFGSGYGYIGYMFTDPSGNQSSLTVPSADADGNYVSSHCLMDGSNTLLASSTSDYWGWDYNGSITITDSDGDVLFGPYSCPTGYEYACTSSTDCSGCSSLDSTCVEVEMGNAFPGYFQATAFGVNVVCDDTSACNEGEDGLCWYPVDDITNCDGTCGGVNQAVEDCSGVCDGTALDTDWICDSQNIVTGSNDGSTSGLIFDDGGLTGNYSDDSNNSYTIDVPSGIIEIDVMSVDIENYSDTLWLCDGEGSPSHSPWNGSGNCTQITNSDAGTSWSSTGSLVGVYFESSYSTNYTGFQLSWSNNTDLCEDDSACNTGAVSACQYPPSGFDCNGDCLAGTSLYTLDATCNYSYQYDDISYFVGASNSGDPQTTDGTPVGVCLADGLNTFYASDDDGNGWSFCDITITDSSGGVVFGPYSNPSGYEFICTGETDCPPCPDDGSVGCVSIGGNITGGTNDFATTWHSTDFAIGDFTCPDTAACNHNEDGVCVYPLNDNTNCDGTCGGVNQAVEDCTGVCAGDADPNAWSCNMSNIEYVDGQTLTDDTGSLKDSGEDSEYSSGEYYSVTISNGNSGNAVQLTFEYFDYESSSTCGYDYLMINDGGVETKYCGTNTPGVNGVYTASGNSLTLTHSSDGSVTEGGFYLTWAYIPSGCTDSTACNYDENAQADDNSCTFAATNYDCAGNCLDGLTDGCGLCGGLNASQDCAGTCSGTLDQGTFTLDISYAEGDTQNEVYTLTAGGGNWGIENCSNFNAEGSLDTAVSFSAACDLISDFWAGPVTLTLSVSDLAGGLGSISLSGTGFSASVDGAVDLANSTGNTLIGDTVATTIGGAVADNCNQCDTDPTNDCTQDCNGQWGGTADYDECGVCGGLNASKDCAGTCSGEFAEGSFALDISYAEGDTENEVYSLSASGSNWSVANCSNYIGEGGESGAVSFSANCDLTSSFWVGPVSLALSIEDASTGLGSISITGQGLSASLSGSIDTTNSVGNTLAGTTSASSVGGAPDNDSDGLCDDVDADDDNDDVADDIDCDPMDGTVATENACGVCVNAASSISCDGFCIGTLSAGTFSLSVGDEDADGNDNAVLSASGDNWSISDCGNWNASGGDNTALAFSADCTLTSDIYVGSVTITLDLADQETGTGSVTVTSLNFSTSLSGSVDDVTLFPNITGTLAAGSSGTTPDFDSDGICDADDSDADNDDVPASTDGITGDCNDFDPSITACTYASCDDWGGLGCIYDNGTVATWDASQGQGWWNCAEWGGQVCGLAQVNFEVDTNGSTEAANLAEMGIHGTYNNWNSQWDRLLDGDGDGVYTTTLYLPVDYDSNIHTESLVDPYEVVFFNLLDGVVIEEELLDFGSTVLGEDQYGPYYEYLNASCAPATNYYNYANRVFSIADTDINNSITIKACYGSCNETCLTGCTDSTSCTYTALDNLEEDSTGQPNYDGDDGSCDYNDTCGFCGALDANLDCNGDCSGSLGDGSVTELPGTSLTGSGTDWSLSDCTVASSTSSNINPFVLNVLTDYACELSSNVFTGSVTVSTSQTVFANSDGAPSGNPAGYEFDISLNAGSMFSFATTSTVSGAGADGITGALSFADTFGLVGTGVDNKGTDCNAECGGSAFFDDCGVCAGGGTVFSAGSFTLEPNATDDDWNLTASATDGSWSLGNCSNYDGSGAPDNNLAFTADCVISSVAYSGTAALTLTLSDVADDGSATGSVSLSAPGFSATASGSVADSSTFPTLNGSLSAFGEFPNEDNLGCGCFNDAPLTYYQDEDLDGLGSDTAGLYCLETDLCNSVAGGCSYATAPTITIQGDPAVPETCVNDDSTADSWGDTCSSWYDDNNSPGDYGCSGGYNDSDFNASVQCCACGGGNVTPANPGTPDIVQPTWVLNTDDLDDNCVSNVFDCDGACDGPGNNTDTADGSCCASGSVDCAGACDSALIGTGVDNKGTDCDGVCGGTAEVHGLFWTQGSSASWSSDNEASFTISDSQGNFIANENSGSACFLAGETYDLSLCDSASNGWSGSTLSIDDEVYSGPYSDIAAADCSSTSFSLEGTGGCMSSEANNYDPTLTFDWDNGSCLWLPLTPVNFTVAAEDEPADHAGDIGFRISWDASDHAEAYFIEYFNATEIGSDCVLSSGAAGIIVCDGDCRPASWYNDSFCDWPNDYDCEALQWDGGDCCAYSGQIQSDDPDGLCYEAPNTDWAAECAAVNGHYCGEGLGGNNTLNDCVAEYFQCDGSDDCTDGSDEVLISNGGICEEPAIGDTCIYQSFGLSYTGVLDCSLDCVSSYTAGPASSGGYGGDGYCDGVDEPYGIHLNCEFFNYDGGDCDAAASAGLTDLQFIKLQHGVINTRANNLDLSGTELSLDEAYELRLINKDEYMDLENSIEYANALSADSFDGSTNYRTPVGWMTLTTTTETEYFDSGYSYGDTMEYRVSSVTNAGTSDATDGASDTVPLLTVPTGLRIIAGPQDPDDIYSYEYVNLLWEYPTFEAPPFPDCDGNPSGIGDGYCESANNNELCGYDGGDCCEASCDSTLDSYSCTECVDCGSQSDNSWASCYDPENGGSGVPTCNDDYQFGAVVAECYNYSNTIELYWNSGCSGQIYVNGNILVSDTDNYAPPVNYWGLDPSEELNFEFVVDDVIVATTAETTSDEDCDAPIENCNLGFNSPANLGNGICSSFFNTAECDWDGGDCCPGDCEGSNCNFYGGDCSDCSNPDSADVAEGGECYVPPCYGVSITSTGDSYCSEVSWTLNSAEGYLLAQGGCNSNVCLASLDAGWTVTLNDSYGDGWQGHVLTVDGQDFSLSSGSTACYDSTGAACPDDGGDDGTCVNDDSTADSYGDTCTAWYDNNAYSNSFGCGSAAANTSTFNACTQCCACADHPACAAVLSSSGEDSNVLDVIRELRAELSSLEENSKEWWDLYKKLNDGAVTTEGPEADLIAKGAIIAAPEFDMVSEDSYGIATQFEYKLNTYENSNTQEYRVAEGFVVYSVADDGSTTLIGTTTTAPQFTVTSNTVGCYAVGAYDSSPSYYSDLSSTVCIEQYACPVLGDLTGDEVVNVSDIVFLVNSILGSGLDASCADMNGDGNTNVSDVVALVNVILNGRVASLDDASEAVLVVSDNSLRLESNGFVQGIHMTLSHDSSFELDLAEAFVSEFKTTGNQTSLMIVTDGSHSINDIATFSGDIIIESIHVVNQSGDVTVEETVEIASFQVKVTGPNPFNPSTQLNIVVPEAGFVSVNVYNILGQKVATLVDGYMEASAGHVVNFNANNLASGVYLVRAVTANEVSTQKLMLLK